MGNRYDALVVLIWNPSYSNASALPSNARTKARFAVVNCSGSYVLFNTSDFKCSMLYTKSEFRDILSVWVYGSQTNQGDPFGIKAVRL